MFEDEVAEDTVEVSTDDVSNDTNEDEWIFFAHMTNHYLCLVRSSSSENMLSRHEMRYPIIADSGANYHIFKEREFFETLQPASGKVILGDGKTMLTIKGTGMVHCKIGDDTLLIHNVRYIPDLAETIYSLFLHIQSPGHGLQSSFEEGLFILFPSFKTKAILVTVSMYTYS
jgi:hypothetical protein